MDAGRVDLGWYYSRPGAGPSDRVGPVSFEQLVAAAHSGLLAPDDFVFSPRLATWQRAAEVPGLFAGVTPAASAAGGRSRPSPLFWLVPLIVVILAGGGLGAYFGVSHHHDADDLESHALSPQAGEVFLEPSGVAGPASFSGERFVTAQPTTSLSIPNPAITLPPVTSATNPTSTASTTLPQTTTVSQLPAAPGGQSQPLVMASYAGDTPALYGGSKSKLISDKEGELAFLAANPDKAAAFCAALNSDPTLRWSGGNQVQPDQLPDYFAELTPLMLTRDTRVTNWGYRDGRPIPRQSVLEAGQFVLVDRYGVPRKRCECGNPLTPPAPSRTPPVYMGPRWQGFSPGNIIVVQQTTVVINNFTVIDINTGQPFGRPPGTEGSSNGDPQGGLSGSPGGASTTSTSIDMSGVAAASGGTVDTSEGTTGTTGISGITEPGSPATTPATGSQTAPGTFTVYKLDVVGFARSDSDAKRTMNVGWEVEVTINPDGSLSGSGTGQWHADGAIFEHSTQTGTFSIDATVEIDAGGYMEQTAEGRVLHIQQKLQSYQITKLTMDTTSDRTKAQASIEAEVQGWISAAVGNVLLQAGTSAVYAYGQSGGYEGSINLLPVR